MLIQKKTKIEMYNKLIQELIHIIAREYTYYKIFRFINKIFSFLNLEQLCVNMQQEIYKDIFVTKTLFEEKQKLERSKT